MNIILKKRGVKLKSDQKDIQLLNQTCLPRNPFMKKTTDKKNR